MKILPKAADKKDPEGQSFVAGEVMIKNAININRRMLSKKKNKVGIKKKKVKKNSFLCGFSPDFISPPKQPQI